MKLNSLLLNDEMKKELSVFIKRDIEVLNAVTFYKIAKLYNLTSVANNLFSCIERCFSMIVETPSFVHLDFNLLFKVFKSSGLSIDSEVQVFNAASDWLKHNSIERSKYAKQLLLTVRLPLLSDDAIKYLLDNNSIMVKRDECVNILKGALISKQNFLSTESSSYYTGRYCEQNMFNILLCGRSNDYFRNTSKSITQIDGKSFNCVKSLLKMNKFMNIPEQFI